MKAGEIHKQVDRIIARSLEGENIPCKSGCFHCCREMVVASSSEVKEIVESLTMEQKERVTERTANWLAKFWSSGPWKEVEPYMQDYRRLYLWCPLLENGKCMVYEKLLASALKVLSEHFDAVQIFATRYDPENGSKSCARGFGNWFTRYGQTRAWLLSVEQEERDQSGYKPDKTGETDE